MKLLLAYFSATGNTAQIAGIIKTSLVALGAEVDELDITSYADRRESVDLTPYQAVIFGAPIHSNRAPRIVRDWLNTLNGEGRKCATFFTYGGFGVHPTHYSTRTILEARNFVLVASAEFLGKHTFNLAGWSAMTTRPDEADFEVAREFAEKIYPRFTGEDPGLVGPLEKTNRTDKELDEFEKFRFKAVQQLPTRNGAECSMCLICEDLCPTHAMDAQQGAADPERCIVCLRCLANCPEGVLHVNDLRELWQFKLQGENETAESLNQKKSRIYL